MDETAESLVKDDRLSRVFAISFLVI